MWKLLSNPVYSVVMSPAYAVEAGKVLHRLTCRKPISSSNTTLRIPTRNNAITRDGILKWKQRFPYNWKRILLER